MAFLFPMSCGVVFVNSLSFGYRAHATWLTTISPQALQAMLAIFISSSLAVLWLAVAPPALAEVCPGGFTPTAVDLIFAIENTNAAGATVFAATQSAVLQAVGELGRYVAPGRIRVAVASYGADVCSTTNPCSSFLDFPTLATNAVSALSYAGMAATGNVQNLISNYVATTLQSAKRASTPAVLVIFTSSDTASQAPSLASLSGWSSYLQVYTVDMGGNQTVSAIESAVSTSLSQNAVLAAAWAGSGSSFADAIVCPGLSLM